MFVSPMLLQSSSLPPDDEESCITELKLDGFRMILSRMDGKTRLYTRHKNEITNRFPEIAEIDIEDGTVLDGELVAYDEQGKPDFELLQKRFQSKSLMRETPIQYMVFDILQYQHNKVTHKRLKSRKALIPSAIPSDQNIISPLSFIFGDATSYFKLVAEMDLEGIVTKNPNSFYSVGTRSKNWVKVINYKYKDVAITGYRKSEFGLLLKSVDGDYLGVMEFMTKDKRKEFYGQLKVIDENKDYVYIEPIVCKVKYRNLTKKNMLRIPSFVDFI